MDKRTIATGEAPVVKIEADGDLQLKGGDDFELVVKTDDEEGLSIKQNGNEFSLHCTSNCNLRVPRQAQVQVSVAHGNAEIKGIDGPLMILQVHGDLSLRSVGPTTIETVSGNLAAKHIGGPLQVGTVHGDAMMRDVQGPVSISKSVNGSLKLDDIEGPATARANGDVTLRFDPDPGQAYDFTAGGNLLCRLPEDACVDVRVRRAAKVAMDFEIIPVEGDDDPRHYVLGDGDASMVLSAGGNVRITSMAPDWEMSDEFDADVSAEFEGMAQDISEQVISQLEAQVQMMERQLEEQMRHLNSSLNVEGIAPDVADQISRRAREASARATARAQEKMQLAQERMQRKMEAINRKVEVQARRAEQQARRVERQARSAERRSWRAEFPTPPTPPMPPMPPEPIGSPVSDEERLLILRMLAEKKITAEEAEKLLAALEGPAE